jgi:hypothetical protein
VGLGSESITIILEITGLDFNHCQIGFPKIIEEKKVKNKNTTLSEHFQNPLEKS